MSGCPWWARWLHRRRRMLDIEGMWRTLYARADLVEEARLAWEIFLLRPAQEHWRCPCGAPIRELFRTITVQVEP